MTRIRCFSCVLYIDIAVLCITFLNMLPLIFFSLNIENVGECCKVQRVCRPEKSNMQSFVLFCFLSVACGNFIFSNLCIQTTDFSLLAFKKCKCSPQALLKDEVCKCIRMYK